MRIDLAMIIGFLIVATISLQQGCAFRVSTVWQRMKLIPLLNGASFDSSARNLGSHTDFMDEENERQIHIPLITSSEDVIKKVESTWTSSFEGSKTKSAILETPSMKQSQFVLFEAFLNF